MTKLEQAIAYFEDAIRESDEIIAECSEKLQKELIEQKKHFEVALDAMKICTWIPVNNRLPVVDEYGDVNVLVCMDDEFIATATYDKDNGFELWADSGEVIAWMPLPEPYQESDWLD